MAATNLPVQLTSFVGREHDLTEVSRLLSASRLLTLCGVGGCGKTRLAIQIAGGFSDSFADGVWMVDLTSLRDPALIPQTIAQALDLHPVSSQPILESLLGFIRHKQMLLLLDNCEHLIAPCAQLVGQLLAHAPGLSVLATSREALAIAGETVYPLQGLTWPSAEKPRDLLDYDAVRLFGERARAAAPSFSLTPENAAAVIEVCKRLDGIPLALELAAARVRVLTPQEIAERLKGRLALLTSGQRSGLAERHATLRAAIDWSHALLTLEEQILFRRLGVFEAGCTLNAAEAVCAGEGVKAERLLELLSSLVDKSLVLAETLGRAQARYRMLETLREYALEKLSEAGEVAQLRDLHLELFLSRAEEATNKLYDADQQLWLNWLEGERDNLRGALAWALESGRTETGLRLATALTRFWEIRGYAQEGGDWFGQLLAQTGETIPLAVRVNALTYAAFHAHDVGNVSLTMAYSREAVALAESVGEEGKPLLIFALHGLSSGAEAMGDYQATFAIQERAIKLERELAQALERPSFMLGMPLLVQGGTAIEVGKYDVARAYLNEGLTLAREAGDAFRIAHILNSFGNLARCESDYAGARTAFEQSVAHMRELGAQRDLATPLHNLGFTCLHLGDPEQAHTLFRESMEHHRTQHDRLGMAECLVGFAAIAIVQGLPVGVRWLAAAGALNRPRVKASWAAFQMERERYQALAQAKFGKAEFQAEWVAGQQLRLEEAVESALHLPLVKAVAVSKKLDDLTERERELAALIGLGKSNGDIADELSLSKRTVEKHIANILSKLGFTSRAQVVRWAIENRMESS